MAYDPNDPAEIEAARRAAERATAAVEAELTRRQRAQERQVAAEAERQQQAERDRLRAEAAAAREARRRDK